uniref:Uncharacterized protein n=1 Tax=Anguilla anguilla TaxID=7936 RepID=A0A0E9XT58_ANGAN
MFPHLFHSRFLFLYLIHFPLPL